jgi:hypothetical protein
VPGRQLAVLRRNRFAGHGDEGGHGGGGGAQAVGTAGVKE